MVALTRPGSVVILGYGAERAAVKMFFEMAKTMFDIEYVSDEELQAVRAVQERSADKLLLGGSIKIALMHRRKGTTLTPTPATAATTDMQVCQRARSCA